MVNEYYSIIIMSLITMYKGCPCCVQQLLKHVDDRCVIHLWELCTELAYNRYIRSMHVTVSNTDLWLSCDRSVCNKPMTTLFLCMGRYILQEAHMFSLMVSTHDILCTVSQNALGCWSACLPKSPLMLTKCTMHSIRTYT